MAQPENINNLIDGSGFRDKLLVIGKDTQFSAPLIDYAINMSIRMGYSLIAVSFRLYQSKYFSQDRLATSNKGMETPDSENGVIAFRKMAETAGIGFESIYRVGGLKEVVHEIYQERNDIDLTIMDPVYVGGRVDEVHSIPAFSLAPGER